MEIRFIDDEGTFEAVGLKHASRLYFPLTNKEGVMSNITPRLSGDNKIGQNAFLLEPASIEDLQDKMSSRNMWFSIADKGVWDAAGTSAAQMMNIYNAAADQVKVTAGKLWHQVTRTNTSMGVAAEILNYCPATDEKVEIMRVTFTNNSEEVLTVTPVAAVPIYARSADNIRDHRHVTSLLHQIYVEKNGVTVTPVLSFDERGHRRNEISYSVFAESDSGERPVKFYPTREMFIGEQGTPSWPEAVVSNTTTGLAAGSQVDGYEAFGGLEFPTVQLLPGAAKSYQIILSYNREGLQYLDSQTEHNAFREMQDYWREKLNISCRTENHTFDQWLSWVGIQPELRRIFGCSFMPHHDYGRGGRGWRDLWQDSLALLLQEPEQVKPLLISYFAGVRMDGSNATIIGSRPGEFIADRNSIVRVWMDHGLWPLITLAEYIEMTGDIEILLAGQSYFKDAVSCRGEQRDNLWNGQDNMLKDANEQIYMGTLLEHLLVQHLTIFYDVGVHNQMRLRGADWNDALDMAGEYGESVAFTAAYSGNLLSLAELITYLQQHSKISEIKLPQELMLLISQSSEMYEDIQKKQAVLEQYCKMCGHKISGKRSSVRLADLSSDLTGKAQWLQNHIRKQEWLQVQNGYQWFNSYYDNHQRRVEGEFPSGIRMMLTGQVFAIMSGTATDEQVAEICKSADRYLYDQQAGGYRLNTDFHELKTDLGRMFGFAYGHKENGAVFCHMAVMYGYALYKRGFVKEGYKVIKTLSEQAADSDSSGIYPGIPEYFDDRGRGMYHYLTGAASWLMLTVLTRMFGIRGKKGDLSLTPGLVREQFDKDGYAGITCNFAGLNWKVVYENKGRKDIGDYDIEELWVDGQLLRAEYARQRCIPAAYFQDLAKKDVHDLYIVLS